MSSSAQPILDQYFGAESPIARELSGFAARPEQLEMATLVLDAIRSGEHLAVEAGAGTGKTLAYLIPALISGVRVIVATATRTLQDQLYHRDLPLVSRALGRPVRIAQLKGRGNYLCLHRLERLQEFPDPLPAKARRELKLVERWAARTSSGDIGELAGVPEDSRLWERITSTADNCLGGRCPALAQCHVVAARKAAIEADLAIVNHHLLVADMTLREDGFGRLLPGADVVIVDEAHRLPDVIQSLFDISLSSRQLDQCVGDIRTEGGLSGVLDQALMGRLDGVSRASAELMTAVGSEPAALSLAQAPEAVTGALDALAEELEDLEHGMVQLADVSAGLARCGERVAGLTAAAARELRAGRKIPIFAGFRVRAAPSACT